MLPSEAILILRNTGHTAEYPRFEGDTFKVNGVSLTREQLFTMACDQDKPVVLF